MGPTLVSQERESYLLLNTSKIISVAANVFKGMLKTQGPGMGQLQEGEEE